MKIAEILQVLQVSQNVRVIIEKGGDQVVYQGEAGGLSAATYTDCDIIYIAPESVYRLPHGATSILNIFIRAEKFAKREYPEY